MCDDTLVATEVALSEQIAVSNSAIAKNVAASLSTVKFLNFHLKHS